jgi:hypothetical protein
MKNVTRNSLRAMTRPNYRDLWVAVLKPLQLLVVLLFVFVKAQAAYTETIGPVALAAGGICGGTTKAPVYSFSVVATGGGTVPNLTAVTFTTNGTYVAGNVTKFQLWFNTSNNLSTATQLGSNITSSLGAGSHTFSGLSQTMDKGSTFFFWITTDVASGATAGNTIAVSAFSTSSITISAGTVAGSGSAGGTQTINGAPGSIFGTLTVCMSATTSLSNSIVGGTWSSSSGNATISAGGVVTGVTAGTSAISYTTGCGSAVGAIVTVTAAPTAYGMTGGGSYCSGGAGLNVGLANSQSGVNYQLYNGASTVGSPQAGGGSLFSFGTFTASGTYSVLATNASTSCTAAMSSTASITINTLPTAFSVTGGGAYCVGGAGLAVGIANSQTGVNYQLYNGASAVGSVVAGNGSSRSFGTFTASGTYSVLATNATTSCTAGMTGTATITINALPTAYAMTGSGTYCAGSSGAALGLANSQSGVNYQLYRGATLVGSAAAGTGSSFSFGSFTTTGTYSVLATNATTSCTAAMSSTTTVSVNALPSTFSMSGGGAYCAGGAGVVIGLGGSQSGVNYQLYNGASPIGSAVAGSGSSFSFGTFTTSGTYSVLATSASTSCAATMIGTAVVSINSLPTTNSMTGGGAYCAGGSGVAIGLGGSQTGVNYQLYNGATTVGSVVAGSGLSFSFGTFTASGTYSVLATSASTSCAAAMTGTASVSINPLPTAYSMTGGGAYCTGGPGMGIGLGNSQSGVNYQLYRGATLVGSAVSGTGGAFSFGTFTTSGTYSVLATNATTSCTAAMSSTTTVSVNALPSTFSMSGGGAYCSGGSGVIVGLGGSQSGVNYQLYNGASATGSPVSGSGSSLSFGTLTTSGTYSVLATSASTSCTAAMTGTASISINAKPTTYSMTGGGAYCSGGSGVAVGVGSSQSGVNYQLYKGATPVGSSVAGDGSSLSFGTFTTSGNYSVAATDVSTSCTTAMSGTASISIDPLPAVFSTTGGGGYCIGGSGVAVGLGGSESGINYQLYNGATMVGSAVVGSGSSFSFGTFTTSGAYSVLATNALTSCAAAMSGTTLVSINPLPTAFSLTGGGSYCSGGSGVSLGLGGSETGVNYQLYNGASAVGSVVVGIGSALSFGSFTAAGDYSVVATNASTGCASAMTGSSSVSIDPLPTAYAMTGGGSYCSGGSGVSVGLGGSETGVNYQLYNGASAVGSAVGGTGSALSFGSFTAAGDYSVVATNASTGCASAMTGSSSVSIDPLPTAYAMTGGGSYCSGGSGVNVGLGGSETGVNYQLYNGASAVGSAVGGTGSALSFGSFTAAGDYSVVATNASTGCASAMTGSSSVSVDPLPTAYAMTSGGSYCSGGTGVSVGLGGSETGVNYQLYNGASAVGSAVGGTGSSLSFGSFTTAGDYSVVATNASTGCASAMTGSSSVSIDPLPTAYALTGGGSYCSGGSGVSLGLGGSETGVNYQLYNGASSVGSAVAGTGSALSFDSYTAAGDYSVVATNASTGCTSVMTGSSTVSLDPLPTTYAMTGGGSYCSGGSGVSVGLGGSETGVNYQLYNGASAVGSAVGGTGSSLSFGSFIVAGDYSVVATNASTGCASAMTGLSSVSIDPLPTAYALTGGGSYCSGGAGVSVGLGGSETGVNYQLYNGASSVGSAVGGTGSSLSFGSFTAAGDYSVVATIASTGCASAMTGSSSVSVDPLPTAYAMTGGGSYCSGGIGVSVGLGGSETGVNYQIYNGASTVGSAVGGTGSALSFGSFTVAGDYSVVATNASTGCASDMTGSSSVSIDPLPTAFAMTGGGSYCSGGSGVSVGLGGSETGVNYQLYNGASAVGSAVGGTGSSLSFGSFIVAGDYSVVATNASTVCTSAMTGFSSVSIDPLPTAYAMTGGGSYCSGGTGVGVGLGGSETGVNYQLYNSASSVGSAVGGTGSALSFGSFTATGDYSAVATNGTTGCSSAMTGSSSVSIDPLPTAYAMTGGGSYCSGGSGVSVGLGGSETGVNYQLYNGASAVGSAVGGTGSSLSFGSFTAVGDYSVVATNASTGCSSAMTGSSSVSIDPLPTAYAMTGGGSYCSGGSGVSVGLGGSETGVNYQLYTGASTVGSAVGGTGSALSFGSFTVAGDYSVVATNASTGCASDMTGSSSVSIDPLPTAFAMTGGGSYCSGGSGVSVGLGGSETGVNYQLYNGASAVGSAVGGTGSALSFGSFTAAGDYSVVATNASTGCTSDMTGLSSVSIDPLPTAHAMTGGGSYCSGGTGVGVGLGGSETGVNYQLYNGASAVGSAVGGTGSSLSFGSFIVAGDYSVVATNASTGCSSVMTGSSTVSVDPLPTTYAMTGGGSYCFGGTGVSVGLGGSETGVNYQLYNGVFSVGDPMVGTGAALDFGLHTDAGTYSVVATNATTGCTSVSSSDATISINRLPDIGTISGVLSLCVGAMNTLSNTVTGGSWASDNTAVATVDEVSGIVSGVTSGTATISYTTTNGCGSTTATAVVTVNHVPDAGTIVGTPTVCVGASTTFSNTVLGGSWSTSSGITATVGSTGIVNGVAAGTATISYSTTNNCGTSIVTQDVTVNPLANAGSITGASSVCVGGSVTLSDGMSGGSWSASNSNASVDGTGIVSGLSAGNVAISYTVINNCGTDVATRNIVVNPLTSAGTLSGAAAVCGGATTTLASTVSGGAWSGSNAIAIVGSATGIVSGASAGTVALTYAVTGTCGVGTAIINVTVNATPAAIGGTPSMCVGTSTTLSDITPGGTWGASGPGVATVSTIGVVTGMSANTTTISYTVSGCAAVRVVTVNPVASAGIISGVPTVGVGSSITLSSSVSGGSWSASNSNASVNGTGVVSGLAVGTVTISYTASNSCGTATATKVLTVSVNTISGVLAVCSGGTTTLSSSTPGGTWISANSSIAAVGSTGIVTGGVSGVVAISYSVGGAYTITNVTVNPLPAMISGNTAYCSGTTGSLTSSAGVTWASDNTSVATIASSGLLSAVAGGSVAITATNTIGCARTVVVTVTPQPSLSGTAIFCKGSTSLFTPNVSGGAWGGGAAGVASVANGLVTGAGAGTAVITYTVGGLCRALAVVTVNSLPASIMGVLKTCPGSTTTLTNSSSGSWSSTTPSVATIVAGSGVVTGVSDGTTLISYTNASGCSVSAVVTVNALPAAIAGAAVCPGTSVSLSGATSGTWSSGNTTVATVSASTGVASGIASGTAMITYVAPATYCIATTIVTVNSTPAIISGPATGCVGTPITLMDSVGGGTWSSGASGIASVNSSTGVVIGVITGNVNITYTTGNGCYKVKSLVINVPPTIVGYGTICVGLTTTLTSWGLGTWSSSNATVASVIMPAAGALSGISAGNAIITFTHTDGCYSTYDVSVIPLPAAISGTSSLCSGQTTVLTNTSPGGSWTSGNVGVATIGSATGALSAVGGAGTVIITYAYGANCRATMAFTVKPLPAVIGGVYSVCATGGVVTLSDITSGGIWSSSNAAAATIGTGASVGYGAVTGHAVGTTTISYTLSTGCARTAVVTVNSCSRPEEPGAATVTSIQLYPNPTTGRFTVETGTSGVFIVYALDGREVTRFDVVPGAKMLELPQGLTNGTYQCRFIANDGQTTATRIVLENQ